MQCPFFLSFHVPIPFSTLFRREEMCAVLSTIQRQLLFPAIASQPTKLFSSFLFLQQKTAFDYIFSGIIFWPIVSLGDTVQISSRSVVSPLPRPHPRCPGEALSSPHFAYRSPFGRRTELSSSVKISQTSPFGKKHSHKGPGDGCFCVHLGRSHLQLGFMRSKRVMNPSITCTLECVGGLSWGDGPQFSLAAPGLHDPGLE